MMKTTKKLFSLLLALVLTVALCAPAFAEGETTEPAETTPSYTITIKNAANGKEYKAYKIFDATYSDGGVSYTIPEGSAIASTAGFDKVFKTTDNGDATYVTVIKGQETAAIAFLKTWIKTQAGATEAATATTSGTSTVTLNVGAAGYYYVTTDNGSAVSIDTAAPEAVIIDKNASEPSIGPNDGKKVATTRDGDYSSVTTMNIGDTAYFKITFTATNYVVKNETETKITSYTVTDTPDGFDINTSDIAVMVGDVPLNSSEYTAIKNSTTGVLTVDIPWTENRWPSPSTVTITYTATLTNANQAAKSSNTADIKYNEDQDVTGGDPKVEVYNYKIQINKYDLNDEKIKLEGAEFVLRKELVATPQAENSETSENETTNTKTYQYCVVNESSGAVTWVNDQAQATVFRTDAQGAEEIIGLAAGTYELIETKAPNGYNLLETPVEVVLNAITSTDPTPVLTVTADVGNNTGAELPSTGGMGTTILTVVGLSIMVVAAVLLITKKRVEGKEEE